MNIWVIEDDENTAQYWKSDLLEAFPGAVVKLFESAYDAWKSDGRPTYLIFDVGSVGLYQNDKTYLNVYQQIRGKFEHTPIMTVSGLRQLPKMLQEELPEDSLHHPCTSNNHYAEVRALIRSYETSPKGSE